MGKKFCRLFQTGMKGAMYLLPWSMPKLLEGPGKIKELPALIKSKGYDKVLLVTDKTLLQLHLAVACWLLWMQPRWNMCCMMVYHPILPMCR